MVQSALVSTRTLKVSLELPSPETELMPGVTWGRVDAFPSPAYWAYRVLALRVLDGLPEYKLGGSLREEVAACLLGGHGIPASHGLAAFRAVRESGALAGGQTSEEQLKAILGAPMEVGGKLVRYRFVNQKARYLHCALKHLDKGNEPQCPKALREWLTEAPGIGPKTASWIVRNWKRSDDVAILDVHILRVGRAMGLFPPSATVEKNYRELEALFLAFSQALDVRASELDSVMWAELAASPRSAQMLDAALRKEVGPTQPRSGRGNRSHSNARQLALAV